MAETEPEVGAAEEAVAAAVAGDVVADVTAAVSTPLAYVGMNVGVGAHVYTDASGNWAVDPETGKITGKAKAPRAAKSED